MGERARGGMSAVEAICLTLILIFCTPFGWAGMLFLALAIRALFGGSHA